MSSEKSKDENNSSIKAIKVGMAIAASPAIFAYHLFIKPVIRIFDKNPKVNWENEWNHFMIEYNNFEKVDDYESCLKLSLEFDQAVFQILGPDNIYYGMTQGMMGATEYFLDLIPASIGHLKTAIKILRLNNANDNEIFVNSLIRLGWIKWELFDYKEAELLLLEAQDILKQTQKEDDSRYIELLSILTNVYYGMSRFGEGDKYYDLLPSKNSISLDNYFCKTIRSISLINRDRCSEAAEELQNILSFLDKENISSNDYYFAYSFYILAIADSSTMEKVKKHLSIIELRSKQCQDINIQPWDIIHQNIAFSYIKIGDYVNAIDTIEKILKESNTGKTNPKIFPDLYFSLANSYEQIENYDNAAKNYKSALLNMSDVFVQNFLLLEQNDKYPYLNSYHKHFCRLVNFLIEHFQKYPHLILDLFEYRIKTKNILYNDYEQIQKLYSGYKCFVEKLNDDEAYIEIMRSNDQADPQKINYLFFIAVSGDNETKNHPDLIVLNSGNELEQKGFTHFLKSIENKSTDLISYKRYWDKIDERISNYKKIFYSPDGIFRSVNPEILLKTFSQTFGDEKEFICCNSISPIIDRNNLVTVENALLVGDPSFIQPRNKAEEILNRIKLLPIPESGIEVTFINSILTSNSIPSELLVDEFATKENILSKINKSLMHIATHGIQLNNQSPDTIEDLYRNSGLLLTDSFRQENEDIVSNFNGILTADEIITKNLTQMEIAVLSSCQSGHGRMNNIGDMFGFPLALFSAGCRFVLVSLWHIDDKITNELFQLFYNELLSSKEPIQSLRLAKEKLKVQYKHPYYWGGFIIISR